MFIHPIVTNLTTHHPLVHVMLLPLPYPVTNLQPIYVNSMWRPYNVRTPRYPQAEATRHTARSELSM